jgi:hypothetical protein
MGGMTIISRKEAKAQGLKRFFTGRACKRGHVSERFVANNMCAGCAHILWPKYHPPEKERERSLQRRLSAPEEFLRYTRKHREANRDKINAGARRRYKESPLKWKEKQARALAKDPECLRRHNKTYYLRHTEKRKHNVANWRMQNPEKARDQYTRWARSNPDKVNAKGHRRRSRLNGGGESYTKEDIDRIYRLQNGKCAYCRCALKGKYQIDHIVPLSRRGQNCARNIQLLCAPMGGCNQKKQARDPIEFAQSIGLLL